MTTIAETNDEVIAEFRANGGDVAAPYPDPPPMLLVHTIGARTGIERITPMRCLPDGDVLYIFASAHGRDRHPAWYHNLVAHPDITIEKGSGTIPVRATVLDGAERDAIFARQAARFPTFAAMQARLARRIPVVRLERRDGEAGGA
ncbi:MAG TPA: nitroreductase family deazaflavin-dependent oxidoreductase [Thermomicrobiales bacterium]|nr:nitroreductase family deazaflavin-dependent oxidoreductase [Thermomicrobiales bacterium]